MVWLLWLDQINTSVRRPPSLWNKYQVNRACQFWESTQIHPKIHFWHFCGILGIFFIISLKISKKSIPNWKTQRFSQIEDQNFWRIYLAHWQKSRSQIRFRECSLLAENEPRRKASGCEWAPVQWYLFIFCSSASPKMRLAPSLDLGGITCADPAKPKKSRIVRSLKVGLRRCEGSLSWCEGTRQKINTTDAHHNCHLVLHWIIVGWWREQNITAVLAPCIELSDIT